MESQRVHDSNNRQGMVVEETPDRMKVVWDDDGSTSFVTVDDVCPIGTCECRFCRIEALEAEIARAESMTEDDRLVAYGTKGLRLIREALEQLRDEPVKQIGEMDRNQNLRVFVFPDGDEPKLVAERYWSRNEAQAYVAEEFPEAWYGGHGIQYHILADGDIIN